MLNFLSAIRDRGKKYRYDCVDAKTWLMTEHNDIIGSM